MRQTVKQILSTFGRRSITVLAAAGLLAYASAVVDLLRERHTLTAIVLAAVLLAIPAVVIRAVANPTADQVLKLGEKPVDVVPPTVSAPPLLGIELRIPNYQCEAYPQVVAALAGAGARVSATDPAEFASIGTVVFDSNRDEAPLGSVAVVIGTSPPSTARNTPHVRIHPPSRVARPPAGALAFTTAEKPPIRDSGPKPG